MMKGKFTCSSADNPLHSVMTEIDGTPPSAHDRSPSAGRDGFVYAFDGSSGPGEKWRAPHRFYGAIWPFVLGLVLGIFSPELVTILGDMNPWAMWLVFPFVELAARPEFGFAPGLNHTLPQMILFVQFPVEGLWAMLNLRLKGRVSYAVAPLVFLHLAAAFVLFLLSVARS
jgi:hypothetical protein